jgi:hypothetical protein
MLAVNVQIQTDRLFVRRAAAQFNEPVKRIAAGEGLWQYREVMAAAIAYFFR